MSGWDRCCHFTGDRVPFEHSHDMQSMTCTSLRRPSLAEFQWFRYCTSRGTPWEVMRQWVTECPPIVRIRILMRPCVIVGSAAGLKRIFQVCCRASDD